MNNCFGLRFNLHKSGYEFADDSRMFGKMFGVKSEFIDETLAQYEEINSAAAKSISENYDISRLDCLKDKKIILFGDSNTSDRLSWGKIIEKLLPCTVIDGAVSGWRSVQLLSEIDRLLSINKPDIVVVQIGINDSFFCDKEMKNLCVSQEEYKRNLSLIAEKVESFGAELIINSITPSYCEWVNTKHQFWSATEENNELFNAITKEVAKEKGCAYHNFREIFVKEEYNDLFYPDGTHLMPEAHKRIAEHFVRFLGENYGNN